MIPTFSSKATSTVTGLNQEEERGTRKVTLCVLGNFACFFGVYLFLKKIKFSKNSLNNSIKMTSSLDPDQAWHLKLRISIQITVTILFVCFDSFDTLSAA